jgi:hypothetical protein
LTWLPSLIVMRSAGHASEYSSISFFNLFPKRLVEGRTVGLFAETLVPQDAFDRIKDRPGVKEAFGERESINLVVTSMGDVRDEHDLLLMFLEQSPPGKGRPRTEKWRGNVQYRPYTADGPVLETGKELRAVTIFELKHLVQAASPRRNTDYSAGTFPSNSPNSSPTTTSAPAPRPLLPNSGKILRKRLVRARWPDPKPICVQPSYGFNALVVVAPVPLGPRRQNAKRPGDLQFECDGLLPRRLIIQNHGCPHFAGQNQHAQFTAPQDPRQMPESRQLSLRGFQLLDAEPPFQQTAIIVQVLRVNDLPLHFPRR